MLEGWYRWALPELGLPRQGRLQSSLSAGLQLLHNPGYNADRSGPVQVWMLRFRSEF